MGKIILDNVGLDFPVYGANAKSFRRMVFQRRSGGQISSSGTVVVSALKGLSLQIKEGDRVGLVGHNGAGKSTLLRVLAGIYAPTHGDIKINGRVSALFNASLGMDADDTGIENIINIGMYLGMHRNEVDKKIDAIAEFTELGDFLNLPVRTYSSGMQVRLGFAIATAIDPEILLLDEGFGFGDARFADRAEKRVQSLLSRSSVFVLATHANNLIQQLCNRAILMNQGEIVMDGKVDDVLTAYADINRQANGN